MLLQRDDTHQGPKIEIKTYLTRPKKKKKKKPIQCVIQEILVLEIKIGTYRPLEKMARNQSLVEEVLMM